MLKDKNFSRIRHNILKLLVRPCPVHIHRVVDLLIRPSGRGTRRCKSRLDRLDSPVVDRRIREIDDRLRILR